MDSLQDKVIAKHSLERIYPKKLNLKEKISKGDRYSFAAL
jgi:hypothetical protein